MDILDNFGHRDGICVVFEHYCVMNIIFEVSFKSYLPVLTDFVF